MAKLTEKQKRFVDEYLIDLNATQAAIRAGYSGKTAYSAGQRLLKNVEIQKAVSNNLAELQSKRIMDATEVLETLTRIGRGEETQEVVTADGDIIERGATITERTKAMELLGKYHALFTDKVDLTGGINIIIEDDYGDERDPNDTA